MANTRIQQKGWAAAAQSGTSAAQAYTSNVTSGNLLVLAWRYNGSGASQLSNVQSTRTTGNWTIVYDQNDGGGTPIQGGWAYAFATSTGACTVTMNFGASVVGVYMAQGEWNGPVALRVAAAVKTGINQTNMTSNAATAVAGDLQICVAENGAASTNSFSAGSGYTFVVQGGDGAVTNFVAIEELLSSAGGSVTGSFTSSQNSAAVAATVGLGIFTSVFTIAGNAGVAGATVSWTGTSSGSVTADGSGNYTTGTLGVGSYTITPTKTGYSFSPVNSSQSITNANITGVNFTATLLPTGAPSTITITMKDASTVVLSIPNGFTASMFISALRKSGGVWSTPPDPSTPATWWPYGDWQKVVTS